MVSNPSAIDGQFLAVPYSECSPIKEENEGLSTDGRLVIDLTP